MDIDDETFQNQGIENIKNYNWFKSAQHIKYSLKLQLFRPIIKLYLSEEFEENKKFYLDNMKNNKYYKRIKYIYEIAIELILYCLAEFPNEPLKNTIHDFYKYFYKPQEDKKNYLMSIAEAVGDKLYDEINHEITEEDILLNKNYIIRFINENKEEKNIYINPYDYVMEFLSCDLKFFTYEEIIYKMKDINNYSLQKCALNDNILKDEKTNVSFNDYIKKIINHEVLKKTFKQIKKFAGKNYPFEKVELVTQIKNHLKNFVKVHSL